MRWPRMMTRRWVIITVGVALDLALIVQRDSHSLATMAFMGTMSARILLPAMLVLLVLASQD